MDCESKKNTDEYSGVETWGGGGWGKNENDEKNVTGFRLVHGVSMKRCPSQTEKDGKRAIENFNFSENCLNANLLSIKGGFFLHTCHVFRTIKHNQRDGPNPFWTKKNAVEMFV